MYFLTKFLSKIIKQNGFVLTRENDSRKFLIGTPLVSKPLEVKISKKVSRFIKNKRLLILLSDQKIS